MQKKFKFLHQKHALKKLIELMQEHIPPRCQICNDNVYEKTHYVVNDVKDCFHPEDSIILLPNC